MTRVKEQTAEQTAQQIGQQAAENLAAQVAQQVGQQIAESISQAISKVMQSQTQTTGGTLLTGARHMEDVGETERFATEMVDRSGVVFGNLKRTYDEYQHESLESIKRNRSYVDKVLSDAATHDNRTRTIAEQALQNAVETANMISKQAVRHGDIAIDHQWNPIQQGAADALTIRGVALDDASLKAIGAVVAAAAADALKK
jgi:hypothetical protein